MRELSGDLDRRLAGIANDRTSGASDLVRSAAALVTDAMRRATPIAPLARALCRAQPTMAGFWSLAMEALAAERAPERFERFRLRLERAPRALRRFAAECLDDGRGTGPLHVITLSASASVEAAIDALRQRRPVRVSCSESRPALEGRRLAARLAAAGVPVTLFGDAAIAQALASAHAVVLGADAVGSEWFLNKTGSRMLAAAAAHAGVPVYVAATREKFVGAAIGARLQIRDGAPAEIWDGPPAGVEVRNAYFESTPLELVDGLITDVGVLGAAMVPAACEAAMDAPAVQALLDALEADALE